MKVHWLIPLTVDSVLQFTSKNEMARAFTNLGHELTTTVAYIQKPVSMDGFTEVEYISTPAGALYAKVMFHWRMLLSSLRPGVDVVMYGFGSAHLIPLAKLLWLFRERPLFTMDIRTVPVDTSPGFSGLLEKWRYAIGLRLCDFFCDGVTVITPALAEKIKPSLRRLQDKIGIWTSGVHQEHFERKGPDKRTELGLVNKKALIYHGALSPSRGLQNLIRALVEIKKEISEITLILVGDGSAVDELRSLAVDLGVAEKVVFVGKVPYQEIPDYIRTADCAVLPFPDIFWWQVSSPIKIMEYLSVGIPIVATAIEAHKYVANLTGGLTLVENNQPNLLAEKIIKTFKDNNSAVDRYELEQKISWNSQAKKLEAYLSRIGELN